MNSQFFVLKIFTLSIFLSLIPSDVVGQLTISKFRNQLDNPSQCQPLNTDIIELCQGIAYNETRFPNFLKQKTQQDASAETSLYLPLVKINCSPVLKLFICTVYAPPCVPDYQTMLKPCRELCQQAKQGCESTMQRLVGFDWPEYIDCWRFPSFHDSEACVTDEKSKPQQQNKLNKYPASAFGDKSIANSFMSSLDEEQQALFFKTLSKFRR